MYCVAERNTCYQSAIPSPPESVNVRVDNEGNLKVTIEPPRSGANITQYMLFHPVPPNNIKVYYIEPTRLVAWVDKTKTEAGEARYHYETRDQALSGCKSQGFERLCSKAEGAGVSLCGNGWYSDAQGWYFESPTTQNCLSLPGSMNGADKQ